MCYTHPVYTAQARGGPAAAGRSSTPPKSAFAGAYHGWGFHEDGCRSGAAAARHFGVELVTTASESSRSATTAGRAHPAPPGVPALVRGVVKHARLSPVRHGFSLSRPPVARRRRPLAHRAARAALAGIGASDATISTRRTDDLGANVRGFLAAKGVSWSAQRDPDAHERTLPRLRLRPAHGVLVLRAGRDARRRRRRGPQHLRRAVTATSSSLTTAAAAHADKAFYVSPFFGVFGAYELRFTLDGDRVGAFVTLRQHDQVGLHGQLHRHRRTA